MKNFVEYRCIHCTKKFIAISDKVAVSLLDEHLSEDGCREKKTETVQVDWTDEDLKILHGMLISKN